MKHILIIWHRDWLHPKAGPDERYLHEVFRRIASDEWKVVWFTSLPGFFFRTAGRAEALASEDGIRIARVGPSFLYSFSINLFLSKIGSAASSVPRFDALVECVANGGAPHVAAREGSRVVPLYFGPRKARAPRKDFDGPLLVTQARVRDELRRQGVAESRIVLAPPGSDGPAAWDRTASLVLATIENLLTSPEPLL